MPAIEELPIDEMWVGFRPGSRDDAPILGASALPQLVVATGHHRNGILLTPATAEAIAEYILTGSVPARIRPFACDRFRIPGLAHRHRQDPSPHPPDSPEKSTPPTRIPSHPSSSAA